MSTETMTRTVTTDTGEPITAPVLPADNRAGDGYDWMDTLDGTSWSVLPNWAGRAAGRSRLPLERAKTPTSAGQLATVTAAAPPPVRP